METNAPAPEPDEIPQPAVDPVPPPACPLCFLVPSEQGEMMRQGEKRFHGARCVPGQCIVEGMAYPVHSDGVPLRALYPWVDRPDEGEDTLLHGVPA